MAKTLQQLEKERNIRESKIARALLGDIASIQLSENGLRYYFADKNGNNIFAEADVFKKEFGFPVSETDNDVTFVIKGSDDGDNITLVVPKSDELPINVNKVNKKYLELLVTTSVCGPLQVKEKRQAKIAKQQAQSKNVVNK